MAYNAAMRGLIGHKAPPTSRGRSRSAQREGLDMQLFFCSLVVLPETVFVPIESNRVFDQHGKNNTREETALATARYQSKSFFRKTNSKMAEAGQNRPNRLFLGEWKINSLRLKLVIFRFLSCRFTGIPGFWPIANSSYQPQEAALDSTLRTRKTGSKQNRHVQQHPQKENN